MTSFDPEPSCWRQYLAGFGGQRTLKPDAFASVAVGEWDYLWFIEVDRSTESVATLGRKIGQYVEYYRSGSEQAKTGTFPRVAWITDTERQLERLNELFAGLAADKGRLFQAGLNNQTAELFMPVEKD